VTRIHRLLRLLSVSCLLLLLSAGGASGQAPKEGGDPLDTLARVDPRLRSAPAAKPIEEVGPGLAPGLRDGWGRFLAEAHGDWRGFVDRRTGRLELAEGSGIPWLPGRGNHLSLQDLASDAGAKGVDLGTLESIARAFLPKVAPLLGIDPASLALNRGRSGQLADHLWFVDFDVRRGDLAIEGARVVFRVNHGNLVQFGTENLPPADAPVPRQKTDRREALAALAEHIRGFSAADSFLDNGSLHLVPLAVEDSHFAEGFEPGKGRALGLVWDFVFRRKGVTGTWRGRVDATSGEVLAFQDLNAYGQVKGGVYPESYIFANETVLPMPYANLSTGGFADAAGRFSGTGPVSSTLSGQYVRIFDYCGPISMSSDVRGILNFGTSSGTDCTTPGSGGGGNTHASRTDFYHVNRIKEVGRGWLPGNSWLNGQLTAKVNISDICNAFWDYSTINFFRSGGGCGNTGEIAAVAMHEYGHGLDSNDGNGFSPDNGTGEAYADITAALMLRDSCMGRGFYQGNCGGFGDPCTDCSGVRDLDWAKHVSNVPHTVDNFTRNYCYSSSYAGPCGREGHCESQIATEAVWDLAARDLPDAGSAAAWAVVERLWYLSRPTATQAFTCNTASSPWTSNGCSAGSLWRTMRAVDDDDGNLANGTPHSCALFAAFDRHGIACPADPGANVCFSACTAPTVPALSLTAGNNQVQVDWTSSGGDVVYDLYRSEAGCNAGFVKVASDLTGTSFSDTAVANGLTYSYQLIAHPSGSEACSAAPSTCQSAAPVAPPCGLVPAPTGATATAAGRHQINLSWDAVPTASAYFVLRSTAGGPYTEVGSVPAPATALADTGLADGTTYSYVVHAFAGDCESGDSQVASATTDVCHSFTLYSNDFESGGGLADWTAESLIGGSTADWRGIQACTAHSGTGIFRFGGSTCDASYADSQRSFAQPQGPTGIVVPPGGEETRLSFWHRWSFEYGFDGGTLMLSVDGGNAITIPASAIVSGATYNASSYLTNQPIFTSVQSSFVNTTVDLDAACNLATGGTGGCGGHTLSIRFTTIMDGSVTSAGWFLDDVAVTLCAPDCAAPAAPAIGAATTPADNQIQVSWSNGAPAASKFNVYRASGTCAAAGSFTRRASLVSGLSHLDSSISGGLTFAYRVTGTDATGFCESPASACVDATATGPCLYAPIFAGLQSAGDTGQSTCTLDLAWQAATPTCGSPVTYTIYRSTSPDFTPGPENRIAQGVSSTSYDDAGALAPGTTYYYIVRAVHGPGGQEDGNTVRRSALPTGPLFKPGTLVDTFEGVRSGGGFDRDGWTHTALNGGIDWTWYTGWSQSPSHSWFAPQYGFTADQVLVSPVFTAQAGTTLSFWHSYNFEPEFDGGTLEISTDGVTWTVLPDSAFTAGGFTYTLSTGSTNPIAGKRGWSGFHDWTQVQVDLSAWAGSTARVRWHAGEDRVYGYSGWWIDSVTIANASVGGQCDTAAPALSFYTLTPCRLLDTRNPAGPLGGPALQPGGQRTFVLTGICNVPLGAKALSVNMTVTQPAATGYLILFPEGEPVPTASSISFSAGQTRANNGVLKLNDGATRVLCSSSGPVHFILDVNGYFE
jgi:trimeric autotransporter adhesin